jgi:gas vesicle protein
MDTQTQEPRHYGFAIGLLTGTFVGAGLALWLAPRAASELGTRLTDSARSLSERASERLRDVNARVGETVDDLTRTGQGVRDEVAGVVARSAREVERFATASSTQSRS